MNARLNFIEAPEDEWPQCPSCKKDLRDIKYKKRGWLTTLTVFWCPHCRTFLSASTRFNG